VETKLIELYLLICDFYDKHSVLKEQRLSNNHQPLFSDQELLTMYIFAHLQGLTQQRRTYDYFSHHWREWFPALPSYQAFNYRLNQLAPAFELLIEKLLISAQWQIHSSHDRLIDSVPVMLAIGTRSKRARVAPELADIGFCATKQTLLSRNQIAFYCRSSPAKASGAGNNSSLTGINTRLDSFARTLAGAFKLRFVCR
jgi:hypothetical protein